MSCPCVPDCDILSEFNVLWLCFFGSGWQTHIHFIEQYACSSIISDSKCVMSHRVKKVLPENERFECSFLDRVNIVELKKHRAQISF